MRTTKAPHRYENDRPRKRISTEESAYGNDIGKLPLLSDEDEWTLAAQLKDDERHEEAEQRLIMGNLRLIPAIVRGRDCRGAIDTDDLIQNANVRMIEQVRERKFERSIGRFSTYIRSCVLQSTQATIHEDRKQQSGVTHTSIDIARQWKEKEQELVQSNSAFSEADIARELGYKSERNASLLALRITRLEGTAKRKNLSFLSTETRPETEAIQHDLWERVMSVISQFEERDRIILQESFGLVDGEEKTDEEIGRMVRTAKSRIGQLRLRALEKLKKAFGLPTRAEEERQRKEQSRISFERPEKHFRLLEEVAMHIQMTTGKKLNELSPTLDGSQTPIEQQLMLYAYAALDEALNERERLIVDHLYFRGQGRGRTAKEIGVSETTVELAQARAPKKIASVIVQALQRTEELQNAG